MDPKFKVGDIVRIKEWSGHTGDYKYSFTSKMASLTGARCRITKVYPDTDTAEYRFPDDNAKYILEFENPDDGKKFNQTPEGFNWASSMFEACGVYRMNSNKYKLKFDV